MSARHARSLAVLLACTAPSGCIVGILAPEDGGAQGGDDAGSPDGADGADAPGTPEASAEASDAPETSPDSGGDSTTGEAGEGGLDAPAEGTIDAPPGDGTVQDGPPLTKYIVFTTSTTYSGNLGGLMGADQLCQARAAAGNLSGTFKAWLSDSTTSAASRLTHGALPYELVDGTVVAADWTALTSGMLQTMIELDENGNLLPQADTCSGFNGHYVWTDSADDGTIYDAAQSCQNWTSALGTDNGSTGSSSTLQATSYWSSWCHLESCSSMASLYCIQQ